MTWEYNEKIDAVLADASLAPEAQKEKKMALKKEKEAKLMELFSAEQQAKYKEIIEKKEERGGVETSLIESKFFLKGSAGGRPFFIF